MAKSIMLSVQPKWVEKIVSREKDIEVRTKMPKCELPMDVYIYMTKYDNNFNSDWDLYCALKPMQKHFKDCLETCFGKVVAKFTLNKVEEIQCRTVPYKNATLGYEKYIDNGTYKINTTDKEDNAIVFERNDKYINSMFKNEDLAKMCLTPQQLHDYIGLGNNGYAWHIDNLVIFDKPKELNQFARYIDFNKVKCSRTCEPTHNNSCYDCYDAWLTKAPQSFCYVEREE